MIRTVGLEPGSARPAQAFMLLRERHCKGFSATTEQTVDKWIADQGLAEYNRFNDELMTFIRRKRRLRPGPLDERCRRRVFMALYDLDALRAAIRDRNQLEGLKTDAVELNRALGDDGALLRLAIRWLEATIFG